jgi:hypothetical protein
VSATIVATAEIAATVVRAVVVTAVHAVAAIVALALPATTDDPHPPEFFARTLNQFSRRSKSCP